MQNFLKSPDAVRHIALIGDHNANVIAHQAIPIALKMAALAENMEVRCEWVPTEEIRSTSRIAGFDGIWCVPATPYRNMDGALLAIRDARENGRPFLGTCGGFQHAVLEYARNELGWADADHAETAPAASRAVISPLACELVEATGVICFRSGSRIAQAYGRDDAVEGYHCRYGVNAAFRTVLLSGRLQIGAEDINGEIRAVELRDHPFFVATLFQPERAALKRASPPLVRAFLKATQAGRRK